MYVRVDSMMFQHSHAIMGHDAVHYTMKAIISQKVAVVLACSISMVVQVKSRKG